MVHVHAEGRPLKCPFSGLRVAVGEQRKVLIDEVSALRNESHAVRMEAQVFRYRYRATVRVRVNP